MKAVIFFVSLSVVLIGGLGCQQASKNSSYSPNQQTSQTPGSSLDKNLSLTIPSPSNLVKNVQFHQDTDTLLSQKEALDLRDEYLECGFYESLESACKGSVYSTSPDIYAYGPESKLLQGKIIRHKASGKTFYLFRIKENTLKKQASLIEVFLSQDTTTDLEKLAVQTEQKFQDLPLEKRISNLNGALEIKALAQITEVLFESEDKFAAMYAKQSSPRAFYHWSLAALSRQYISKPVVNFFRESFRQELAAANSDYKELFLEQGLSAFNFWKINFEILVAYKAEYAASFEDKIKTKLAISILILDAATDEDINFYFGKKRELPSETVWIRRLISLFQKYGTRFGRTEELVSFGKSRDWLTRTEVAKALVRFQDDLANQWLLRLNADVDGEVRAAAFATIAKRKFNINSFDVSGLIDLNNWQARAGLAKALSYATGREADMALLRLNSDSDGDVRSAALFSIKNRPSDLGSTNLSDLCKSNNWNARKGLAQALKYITGAGANETLLRLSADTDRDVANSALDTLKDRPFDVGEFNVSSLINSQNWNSRKTLAKALNQIKGEGANQALIKLNADTDRDVRAMALASLAARPFDAGDFNVSALINKDNWSARAGLAKALEYIKGKGANQALVQLNADMDGDVRAAALTSLVARPFDGGDFNISAFINTSNWNARAGLASALKHIQGKGANEALLRLSADTDGDVNKNAISSIAARPFDAGQFDISGLINKSNWNSRTSLAKALKHVTGQKSLEALKTLASDSDADVQRAAKESLKALGK